MSLETVNDLVLKSLDSLLAPLTPESAQKLLGEVLELVDEIAASTNWYIASTSVIQATLWDPMRSNLRVHAALIKLERLLLTYLTLQGASTLYLTSLEEMFYTHESHKLVDDEFSKTLAAARLGGSLGPVKIPGLVGLLSLILFRGSIQATTQGKAE